MSNSATVFTGQSSTIPVVNGNGNIFEEVQVAAGGQTVFTLASFLYTPGTKSIFVYQKAGGIVGGAMLRRAVDYIETDSSHITLTSGATAGNLLYFMAYAVNALTPVYSSNGLPVAGLAGQILSKIDGTDYNAQWLSLTALPALLDGVRVNIASASTVNLLPNAATTRNVQITGTIEVDGFQISNGQVWAIKFSGSLIFKNNAAIVTQSGYDIKTSPGDTCFIRATADNVVEVLAYTRAGNPEQKNWNDFRLTLTSGASVSFADTVSSNLYMTPVGGNKLTLFNGTAWVVRETGEISIAIAGLIIGNPYDVFCYDAAGTPTLELTAWASPTARSAAITSQDGVLVKAADLLRKYIGTVVATAANQLTDSARQRLVWNYYNRVTRPLLRKEPAASWAYTVATVRQVNANALNCVEVINGYPEDSVSLTSIGNAANTGANVQLVNGIGYDSTVATDAANYGTVSVTQVNNLAINLVSAMEHQPSIGYHKYNWLEYSAVSGVTTWFGGTFSGISGSWRC